LCLYILVLISICACWYLSSHDGDHKQLYKYPYSWLRRWRRRDPSRPTYDVALQLSASVNVPPIQGEELSDDFDIVKIPTLTESGPITATPTIRKRTNSWFFDCIFGERDAPIATVITNQRIQIETIEYANAMSSAAQVRLLRGPLPGYWTDLRLGDQRPSPSGLTWKR